MCHAEIQISSQGYILPVVYMVWYRWDRFLSTAEQWHNAFGSIHPSIRVWVCESYVVRRLNSTGLLCTTDLRYAPPTSHVTKVEDFELVPCVCICICVNPSWQKDFGGKGLYMGGYRSYMNTQAFSLCSGNGLTMALCVMKLSKYLATMWRLSDTWIQLNVTVSKCSAD